MSNDTIWGVVLIGWPLVAVILAGVLRQTEGDWDLEGGWAVIGFWPFVLAIAAVVGAGWLLSWLGRGPVLLIEKYTNARQNKSKLPNAKLVK